ncbi:MAG: biotin carboxylase N-terminal domain-containing protein [Candidatus Limnocylindria bacterium]
MPDQDLTPREVAEELNVTVRTVQRWVASGTLVATRVGGRVRVSRSSLSAIAGPASPAAERPIRSLLIANRGEIAVRIGRTARAMGIRVIGVHAAEEAGPRGADEIPQIGSYLDAGDLLRVARLAGADAVHPGYGFLAENAAFAQAVTDAGLTWIGPPPDAITAMGDKANARHHAADSGVPVVPGYDGPEQDDATLTAAAAGIGYPLLVKPSAGGGGKGMRVVRRPEELPDALAGARREAQRSFADDRLILEHLVERPRHVEIQVLFDRHGNGVHLGERDCSAQRRNQKILEEAPAPSMSAPLRERMGEAALRVAASVGYVSAGTVEMLLTDSGDFFFLEMNTRLQVEHPVTEAVTGRDIVADQLRIAAGEALAALGLRQAPAMRGHAIEARLYAEDPEAGFLPASGRLLRLGWPSGVRIDSGVEEGDQITDRYDPMIAKLIASGRTRPEALERLGTALRATAAVGVRTNLRFLRWLLEQPVMQQGDIRTDTIGGFDLLPAVEPSAADWTAAANALRPRDRSAWSGGWRLNAAPVLRIQHGEETRGVPIGSDAPDGRAVVDGEVAYLDVEGQSVEFRVALPPSVDEAVRHATRAVAGGVALLTAPMPGRVIAVRTAQGGSVAAGDVVVVIEAMKMEHAVAAPNAGRVARLMATVGQQVQRGDIVAEVEPYHEGDAQ